MLQSLFALRDRAESIFNALRDGSVDTVRGGVNRDTYGPGEQFAHRLIADQARALGLEIGTDALCNTYMTWPGRSRSLPALLTGSHLDSVPGGGNFDGAAGVVAGLLASEALQLQGTQPRRLGARDRDRPGDSGQCPLSTRSHPGRIRARGPATTIPA